MVLGKERYQQNIPATLYIAIMVAFLAYWHWKISGNLSLLGIATFAGFSWMALVYGKWLLSLSPLSPKVAHGLTFQFLIGYFVVNSCLAILAFAIEIGVAGDFLILALGAFCIVFVQCGEAKKDLKLASCVPDILCALIGGVAATLWCADALSPPLIMGQNMVFRIWQDSFYHAQLIRMLAQAHGAGSMSNVLMSGAPLSFYHYASYILPAAIASLTGAGALDMFASFQLPFGILITGLAAFALAASLWGNWSGLAASVALLLLPDSYQQGFANRYLSYDFLQQVNLAGLYGVACAAVAWIFILDGCRSQKYLPIIFGYAFILLTLFYKSHIFVANAFLALMYPGLFFSRTPMVWRVIGMIFSIAVFVLAAWWSQHFAGVPTLRLNFSSAGTYAVELLNNYDVGFFKSFFALHILPRQPKFVLGLFTAGMILFSSFGLWCFATGGTVLLFMKRLEPAILLFPILLIINYLVMALGLAMDTHAIGSTDELLNRPVVWAYFGVVTWTAGAAYAIAFGDDFPRKARTRGFVVLLTLSCFSVPWLFGRDLQTFPSRGFAKFTEFGAFPACLIQASHYIGEHSRSGDLIQDSGNDRNMLVGALAERQEYAVDWMFGANMKELRKRFDGLGSFKAMSDEADLLAFAHQNKIRWYLLRPESVVSWPATFRARSAFDCGGYRVY